MNVNEIRKLAKEVRTGCCKMNIVELSAKAEEIGCYIDQNNQNWSERSRSVVHDDYLQILEYVNRMKPKAQEVVRKNFKTVVREMHKTKYPILEAVKWFATVYAADGYEKANCAKGMIERRGYLTRPQGTGFDVADMVTGSVLATVYVDGSNVGKFEILA